MRICLEVVINNLDSGVSLLLASGPKRLTASVLVAFESPESRIWVFLWQAMKGGEALLFFFAKLEVKEKQKSCMDTLAGQSFTGRNQRHRKLLHETPWTLIGFGFKATQTSIVTKKSK